MKFLLWIVFMFLGGSIIGEVLGTLGFPLLAVIIVCFAFGWFSTNYAIRHGWLK